MDKFEWDSRNNGNRIDFVENFKNLFLIIKLVMFRKQYINFKEIEYIKKILFIPLGIDVPAWIDYGVNSKDKLTKAQREGIIWDIKIIF